jgi:hypothetical protein
MKFNSSIILLFLTSFLLFVAGCAPMQMKPGMTLKSVNYELYIFCSNGKANGPKGEHIMSLGNLIADQTIDVYAMKPEFMRENQTPELCSETLYFKDGILLDGEEVKKFVKRYVMNMESLMNEYIEKNKLVPLPKFSSLKNSEFKIYNDPNGKEFYSLRYKFVDGDVVSGYIYKHQQEVRTVEQRRIREIEQERVREQNRVNAQRLFEQQQERNRIRIQQENERQKLIEIDQQRLIEAERKRLEQQRINQERRSNPFQ